MHLVYLALKHSSVNSIWRPLDLALLLKQRMASRPRQIRPKTPIRRLLDPAPSVPARTCYLPISKELLSDPRLLALNTQRANYQTLSRDTLLRVAPPLKNLDRRACLQCPDQAHKVAITLGIKKDNNHVEYTRATTTCQLLRSTAASRFHTLEQGMTLSWERRGIVTMKSPVSKKHSQLRKRRKQQKQHLAPTLAPSLELHHALHLRTGTQLLTRIKI